MDGTVKFTSHLVMSHNLLCEKKPCFLAVGELLCEELYFLAAESYCCVRKKSYFVEVRENMGMPQYIPQMDKYQV
jgi:hypothetical protein